MQNAIRMLEAATTPPSIAMLRDAIVPEQLALFALSQIRHAVAKGRGVLADTPDFRPGAITGEEVKWARRILLGYGGTAQIPVTSAEADFLFELNDRTVGRDNDPEWSKLFVMAIGSNLMDICGHPDAGFEMATSRADWFEQNDNDAINFFAMMFSGGDEAENLL